MGSEQIPFYRFSAPRYWLTWLGVAVLRLVVLLPHGARMGVGRWLGRRARSLFGGRRFVVQRNLELCFPELTADERTALEIRHFESLGMHVIELGIAWWASQKFIDERVDLIGIEHVHKALEEGRGVLLWSGHFAALELTGRKLQTVMPPMAAMYRPSNNPLNDRIMRHIRSISTADLVSKDSIRSLLRILKQNRPVWYAADQAYNRKGTVLVPFFGEPATTNTAVSQIVRVSKAVIIPFKPARHNNGERYSLEFMPPLEDFPSGDDEADARRLNELLAQQIRDVPEQYYWVHKRFKGRPEGYPDPYSSADS